MITTTPGFETTTLSDVDYLLEEGEVAWVINFAFLKHLVLEHGRQWRQLSMLAWFVLSLILLLSTASLPFSASLLPPHLASFVSSPPIRDRCPILSDLSSILGNCAPNSAPPRQLLPFCGSVPISDRSAGVRLASNPPTHPPTRLTRLPTLPFSQDALLIVLTSALDPGWKIVHSLTANSLSSTLVLRRWNEWLGDDKKAWSS